MRLTCLGKLILMVLGLVIVYFSLKNFAPDLYNRLPSLFGPKAPSAATAAPGAPLPRASQSQRNGVFVSIPAGAFRAGSDQRSIELRTFLIQKNEVTNRDYQAFLAACAVGSDCGPRALPVYWDDAGYLDTHLDYPVVFVSWGDASSYCRFANGRLPTILEWEKAARSGDGRLFPWGDLPDPEIPNILGPDKHGDKNKAAKQIPTWSTTDPRYARDQSPYGILGMAGNASEWTSSASENEPNLMLIAGGSWDSWELNDGRTYHRVPKSPMDRSSSVGFRCAADAR
jgi:formylglycine-generating enzyme required for sulfatase activity